MKKTVLILMIGVLLIGVNAFAAGDACDADSDNDGMPDSWEIQYFGNLNQNGAGDYDNDGLTNLQEYQQGANPIDSDTDDDGIPDVDDICPLDPVIKIASTPYSSLQDAYDDAGEGGIIQSQDADLTEGDFNLNVVKTITLRGGYDCDYTTNTGTTILNGNMRIGEGKLIIDSGKLKID